jgi:hypothetical protein
VDRIITRAGTFPGHKSLIIRARGTIRIACEEMRWHEGESIEQFGHTTVIALACTGKDDVKLFITFAAADVCARGIV